MLPAAAAVALLLAAAWAQAAEYPAHLQWAQRLALSVPVSGVVETVSVQVGDRVGLGISHPCTTFDKWRWMAVVDDGYTVCDAITTAF